MLPHITHVTDLSDSPTGLRRSYVALHAPSYGEGFVRITTTTLDGVADPGDIMVHLRDVSLVGANRDLKVIG